MASSTERTPAMSPSDVPVSEVLDRVAGPRRAEADALLALHTDVSGAPAVVWANRIIGFGEHTYLYESGRGGVVPELAFATSQQRHTVYLTEGFAARYAALLDSLGPHRSSKVCLYITRLARVDQAVLRELLGRVQTELRQGAPGA